MIVKCLGSSSKGNCYVLTHQNKHLILEAGIKVNDALKSINFDLSNIIGLLVTHEHMDHAKYIKEWLSKGVNVYLTHGTADVLGIKHFNLNKIETNSTFELENIRIRSFKTFHDVAEPVGYLIEFNDFGKVLFETDTYKSPYKFKGVRLFLKEANYSKKLLLSNSNPYRDRVVGSHMEIETTIKTLKHQIDEQTEMIILVHLSDGHSNAEEFKQKVISSIGIPTMIADKGVEIEL